MCLFVCVSLILVFDIFCKFLIFKIECCMHKCIGKYKCCSFASFFFLCACYFFGLNSFLNSSHEEQSDKHTLFHYWILVSMCMAVFFGKNGPICMIEQCPSFYITQSTDWFIIYLDLYILFFHFNMYSTYSILILDE